MGRGSGGGSRGGSRSSGRSSSRRSMGGSSRGSSRGYSSSSRGTSGGFSHGRYGGSYRGGGPVIYTTWGAVGRIVRNFFIGVFIFIFVCQFLLAFLSTNDIGNIGVSTRDRVPLDKGSVILTDYINDTTGKFVVSETKMESGMKAFYKQTGVQPYMFITQDIYGNQNPSDDDLYDFSNKLYDELFQDESHLLVVYLYRDGLDDDIYCLAGNKAEIVMDKEARDILLDYFEAYYSDYSLDNSEYVSIAFEKSADRIMSATKPFWITPLILISLVIIIIISFKWWTIRKNQKNKEMERAREIIEMPLENIEDSSLSDLEDKYK